MANTSKAQTVTLPRVGERFRHNTGHVGIVTAVRPIWTGRGHTRAFVVTRSGRQTLIVL